VIDRLGRLKIVALSAEYVDGAPFAGTVADFAPVTAYLRRGWYLRTVATMVALGCGAVTDRGSSLVVLLGDDQLAQRMNISAKHSQSNVTLKSDFTDITTTI